MTTKGVSSVRSPVCNLQQFNESVNHDAFTNAIIREFQKEYDIRESVRILASSPALDSDFDFISCSGTYRR